MEEIDYNAKYKGLGEFSDLIYYFKDDNLYFDASCGKGYRSNNYKFDEMSPQEWIKNELKNGNLIKIETKRKKEYVHGM